LSNVATSAVTSGIFNDSIPRSQPTSAGIKWQCSGSTRGNIIQPDFNDFAGRAGIAWDVDKSRPGHTVIRAGAGIFYDQQPVSEMARLMENRPTQLNGNSP